MKLIKSFILSTIFLLSSNIVASDYTFHGYLPLNKDEVIVSLAPNIYIQWSYMHKNILIVNNSNITISTNFMGHYALQLASPREGQFFQNINHSADCTIMPNNNCYLNPLYPCVGGGPSNNGDVAFNGDRIIMEDLTIINGNLTYGMTYNLQDVQGQYRLYLIGDLTPFRPPSTI